MSCLFGDGEMRRYPVIFLVMVILLGAVLAPAAVAQNPCTGGIDPDNFECNPAEEVCDPGDDCCNLKVFVNTYVKDPDTGDFTPRDDFEECEEFYVNAAVVNTGNIAALANITAVISASDGAGGWVELPDTSCVQYRVYEHCRGQGWRPAVHRADCGYRQPRGHNNLQQERYQLGNGVPGG